MKKLPKLVIIISVILVITAIAVVSYFVQAVQNPFDEMYYSAKQLDMSWGGVNIPTMYTKTTYWSQPGKRGGGDYASPYYEPSNIRENEYILVTYLVNSGSILISFRQVDTDENHLLNIDMTYQIATKTLVFESLAASADCKTNSPYKLLTDYNLTEADVRAYQNYVIYDILLTNWFNGNQSTSHYTMENLGRLHIEDNTFTSCDDSQNSMFSL